jgi:hypothetical protein
MSFGNFHKCFFIAVHKIMTASAMNMQIYEAGRNVFTAGIYCYDL